MSSWNPCPKLIHGKIIQCFLPLDSESFNKKNKLLVKNFTNVYPGDEIFIFEQSADKEWSRGYVTSKPVPADFFADSVNIEKIPEIKIVTAIVPTGNIKILETVDQSATDEFGTSNTSGLSEIEEIELYDDEDDEGLGAATMKKKTLRPPFPHNHFRSKNFNDEIIFALNSLMVHIYTLYATNEFESFTKMCETYEELDNIRIQLDQNLLTIQEAQLAKKRTVVLMGRVAKFFASFKSQRKDVSGYNAIMSRNMEDEELFTYQVPGKDITKFNNPAIVSSRQLLLSLFPNYPVTAPNNFALVPAKSTKLTSSPPSHVLIDFKSVSGSSSVLPKGYDGMTAYMYIRNSKKRLTEAFAITIKNGQDFLLDNLSAALYMNIPSAEVDSGRIYLVTLLTEDIISEDASNSKNTIDHVRKGIAAGVVDISRIFSRHKGSLTSGESHQFNIKLFGSYMNDKDNNGASVPTTITPGMNPMTAMSLLMPNNGWGELIDRIISGSSKGIAINPRAEKLTVSIKEFKNDLTLLNKESSSKTILQTSRAISVIKSMQYDPLDRGYERVYIRAMKINAVGNYSAGSYFTIHMTSMNNALKFNKGTNQAPSSLWRFLSVAQGEIINELLQVTGFKTTPTEGKDYLIFHMYANSEYIGEGRYEIRNNNIINDYKKGKAIDIYGPDKSKVGSFEIETDYYGTIYNVEANIKYIHNWRYYFEQKIPNLEQEVIAALIKFNKVDTSSVTKHFDRSLLSLLQIFEVSSNKNMESLKSAAFDSIVHLLDVVIARQDQFVLLFDNFIRKYRGDSALPLVGPQLVTYANKFFSNASNEWNQIGRALCRISILVIRLADICKGSSNDQFVQAFTPLAKSISTFLAIDKENFVADQLLVIEVLEQWLDVLHMSYTDQDLLSFILLWMKSIGTRGLGSIEDPESTALINKKKSREHKIITSKLILVRRLLHTWLPKNDVIREELLSNSIFYAMEILTSSIVDVDASRLANSILLSLCSLSFGEHKVFGEDCKQLQIVMARLMPTLSDSFNRLNKYCKTSGILEPRRTFTQLFPTVYPFVEYTMDSIIREESFAEVLLEMGTLICFISKISQTISEELTQFKFGNYKNPKGAYSLLDNIINDNEEFVISFIQTVRILTHSRFYPSEKWLSVKSLFIEGCMSMLEFIYPILVKTKIPPVKDSNSFDRGLWGSYLKAVLRCSTASVSAVEHLNDIAKKGCLNITGDIRSRGAKLIEKSWDALAWDSLPDDVVRFHLRRFGGYQVEFITNSNEVGITQELLLFCMQRHESCVDVGIKVLWSIIVSEWLISENLFEVEKECIVGFYEIFHNEYQYTPDTLEIVEFVNKLKATIAIDKEDESYGHVMKLVNTLSGFLSSLSELKKIPFGDEFDDDRTFHKINISGYLMNVNKPEILHEFINEMYETNLEKENYIQAALSMELLANTYEWSTSIVLSPISKPKLPEQSSFERKEHLYKIIAANFIKGNKYEQAVDLYQELLDMYLKKNFDLKGLSYCHGKLSQVYSALETVDRLKSTFFKISFIGFGFPASIRGKEFIYEGLPFEHITSIHNRLGRLYPGSKIIPGEEEANKLMNDTPLGRYLFIKTVTPQKQSSTGNNVLSKSLFMTQRYVDNRDLNTFVSARRLPGAKGIEDLWTEETTYETFLTFPTLMNRSEIRETAVVKISPTLNALKMINEKNEELANVEFLIVQAVKAADNVSEISSSSIFGDLSRILSGTVDSPVNGGVGQYRIFYAKLENVTDESVVSSDDYQQRMSIKAAFLDMVVLLNRCLQLHGKLVPTSMRASHNSLIELYKKNFKGEIEQLAISVDQPQDLSSSPMYMAGVSHQSHGQFNMHQRNGNGSVYAPSSVGSINHGYAASSYSENSNLTLQRTMTNSSAGSSIDNNSRLSSENSSFNNGYHNSTNNSSKRTALNWRDRF